jgi:leader peptidase (prepilin peptidase)/N-methyltransferase
MGGDLHAVASAPVVSAAVALICAVVALYRESEGQRTRAIITMLALAVAAFVGALLIGAHFFVALWMAGLGGVLFAIFEIDRRRFIIPDVLTLSLFLHAFTSPETMLISDRLIGAVVLCFLFAVVAFAYRLWRREDGLGMGDVKLAAAIGALLGLHDGLWATAFASLTMALWLFWRRHVKGEAIAIAPLGSGLCVALLAVFVIRYGTNA